MVLLGKTMLGAKNALDHSPTDVSNISTVILKDGIYDNLFITKNTSYPYDPGISYHWDFDTILNAAFNGNLLAGNIDFSIDTVSDIIIKVREKGMFTWNTIYSIPIRNIDDFKIERFYNFCKSNTEYEFSLVPVINGIEGNSNVNRVMSTFDGIAIMEKNLIFTTDLDIEKGDVTKNTSTTVITPIGSKYPIVINNGHSNYYSGSISATFIPFDVRMRDYNVQNGFSYRSDFMEFLTNNEPKVLKFDDGRMWLISISDSISENENGHPDRITTNLKWIEVGDATSQQDLYDNGLIDVNPGWWVM